jgi:hypothetical protein
MRDAGERPKGKRKLTIHARITRNRDMEKSFTQ